MRSAAHGRKSRAAFTRSAPSRRDAAPLGWPSGGSCWTPTGPAAAARLPDRADVAQLVEHFTRNEGVPGSNPGVGSSWRFPRRPGPELKLACPNFGRQIPTIVRSRSYAWVVDFRRPLRVITPTLDGDVLAALAGGEIEVSGRELHRLVGHSSEEGVRKAADRLVRQGIVKERLMGRTRLYALNREHLAAEPVQHLASLRAQLIERLRQEIAGWDVPAAAAVLFGSVSRKTASETSDVDILMVRARTVGTEDIAWREQLERLSRDVASWTGNDARIIEFSETELLTRSPPVALEALSDGIDLLRGRQLLRRLKQAERE
jgi:predicted nucleotidyltransferase